MHPDELEIDAALVGRLLNGQFPRWADLSLERVPSAGTDNALFRLGDDLVVRLPRIGWAVDQVSLEHEWLPRLAPHLPLAIPAPLAQGAPAEGYPWPWSVQRWLPGVNPVVGGLSDPLLLAADLAHFITALHAIDPAGGPHASRGVPLRQRDAPTRKAINELDGMIDTAAALAAWEAALRVPAYAGPPLWIHADLSPGNLLTVQGRLSAVIDFGCLGVGDPAVDLIVAWNLLPPIAREVFREALRVDDATWARGQGWALSIALIQLPYYHRTNPALAGNARHVIASVL
jgi:aminoglycoside phosphotransferase (APT) family kinase protein